jgi:hypothetical protein
MRKPRDSQRQAVYDWEKRAGLWTQRPSQSELLSLAECRTLVERVWVGYTGNTKNVPVLKDGRGRRRAAYHWDDNSIRMPKWSRQAGMVVHEVAHAIMSWKAEGAARMCIDAEKFASHGPEFVRVLCELHVAFMGADPKALVAAMKPVTVMKYDMRADKVRTSKTRSVKMAGCMELPWRRNPAVLAVAA